MELQWDTQVQYVRTVGPRRAEALEREGVKTVGDLLLVPPFRYEDRARFLPIQNLQDGEPACIHGTIIAAQARNTSRQHIRIFEMVVRDRTGAVNIVFFNQPYLKDVLQEGLGIVLYGKPERDSFSYGGRFQFKNPEWELVEAEADADGASAHMDRVVPIYRKMGSLTPKQLRAIRFVMLQSLTRVPDPIPEEMVTRLHFPNRLAAIRQVHFPIVESEDARRRQKALDELNAGETPSHRRLIFEEFFLLQVGLQDVSQGKKRIAKPHVVTITDEVRQKARGALPFPLTGAQKRVIREIVEDLKAPAPMSRLLQGDVGSGKTIVAVQAAVVAASNGLQAAIMAPTEILAEQHYRTFHRLLDPQGVRVALLKSGLPASEKRKTLSEIAGGDVHVVVGTHSVIQKEVTFARLGLAVIDEQHRFGVMQRAALAEKGLMPDILVMTATPIPRTLALTVYGDLAVSVLDEMPPGRRPPETLLLRGGRESEEKGYGLIRSELNRGNQAYVVYPLIEESEKLDLRNAQEGYDRLASDIFRGWPVGLLHGRMPEEERDRVMAAFRAGEIRILVSTTVIEVGIDVPRATVMLVEHAERFGLSQLHQLRGRIGRGEDPSWCVLVAYDARSEDSRRRLEIMCQTYDGFRIAEEDLAIRGPGEFAGTRQAGLLDFRFGSLIRHRALLEQARQEAEAFVARGQADPRCADGKLLASLRAEWERRYGLVRTG